MYLCGQKSMASVTNLDFSKPIPFFTSRSGKNGVQTIIEDSYETVSEQTLRLWYQGLCSEEELQRVLHVSNAQDYILRTTVDTISADARLCRVIQKHRRVLGSKWSLEKYLSPITAGYRFYKRHLPGEIRNQVDSVGTGCILSNDLNGIIFDSQYGPCSTISYSLKYVVEFASLALMPSDIPMDIKTAAMRIAVRTALGTEALDFDLDKRGIIPRSIKEEIHKPFPYICAFIAGHEYGHFLNGDVTPQNLNKTFHNRSPKDRTSSWISEIYYNSHEKELAADLSAINLPRFSDKEYSSYYFYAQLWFSMLAIIEAAEDYIFPPMRTPSHPSAKIRYKNILEKAKKPYDFKENEKLYRVSMPNMINYWSDFIINDVGLHFDYYEMYGSAYLAEPNTEWRGRELIDRVDY